jgi:TolB-like protein
MLQRFFIGCILVCLSSTCVLPSFAQEKELSDLAERLVYRLEAINQQSGTVLDFTDLQGIPTELGRYLAQELSDKLVSQGNRFTLVDRANLQFLLRENKMSAEGLLNPATTRELGKIVGIDTVIMGTTTPLGKNIRLSVRAVDVETGKIVGSQSTTIFASDELSILFNRGVADEKSPMTSASAPRGLPLQEMLRPGSIKVDIEDLALRNLTGQISGITYVFQNLSGDSLNVALDLSKSQIGFCRLRNDMGASSGISVVNYERDNFTWVRKGQKIRSSVRNFGFCLPGELSEKNTNNITLTFLVSRDDETANMPVTIEGVRTRLLR